MNCKRCKKDKPFDDFYKSGRNRRRICKTCINEKRRANYALNERGKKKQYYQNYKPIKDAADREKISNLKSEKQCCDVLTIAAYLNISTRRVQMLVKRGIIPRAGKRGEYALLPAIHAYIDHLKNLINKFALVYGRHTRAQSRRQKEADIINNNSENMRDIVKENFLITGPVGADLLDVETLEYPASNNPAGNEREIPLPGF